MDKVVPVLIKKKGSSSYIKEEAAKSKHTKASTPDPMKDRSSSPDFHAAGKGAAELIKKPRKDRSNKLRKQKAKQTQKVNPYESTPKPRASRPSETVSIGLGVESQYKKERINASDVTVDEVTAPIEKDSDKSILYAAGWSAEGPFTGDTE